MKRSRLGLTVLLLLPMLLSCGFAMDATPRDIPASQRLLPLENDVTAFESTGSSLIYLVSAGDDRSLKSVRRGGDTQADLLDILLAGPTEDESVAQLSTSLPPDLEILSTRSVGSVAYIDLSGAMTVLSGEALLRGAAQLVLTTVELPGIEAVQLTVAGERFPWLTSHGDTTSGLLRIFDFA
ncbi:MAG: GerMN domain-containing protein, partial [Actinomycetota bacterium]|nr:GerMN domain-containing protein [Actinomycetota bacterium]